MKGEQPMKYVNNERGFTLIEMLVVLLIISMILLIVIPNVTKHSSTINNKGCEALNSMLETQMQAYEIEHSKKPTIEDMVTEKYLLDHHIEDNKVKCPNGNYLNINSDGSIEEVTE